jgi:YjbE family integral membrane protein
VVAPAPGRVRAGRIAPGDLSGSSRVKVLLTNPQFWIRCAEIGFLNLLLSGDNAVVIALAVRTLPRRQRLLGQIWGTVGAVGLRLAFVSIVSLLLRIPFLRLVGGLLLVWIAYKLVQPVGASLEGGRHGTSFWEAIWIIIVADITMSLDNVLAIAAAAHGDMALVILGVAISLPIVVGGSGILAALMNRYGWIIWIGGGILGYVAGDMILEDPVVMNMLGALAHTLEYPLPLAVGVVIATIGWWLARRQERESLA